MDRPPFLRPRVGRHLGGVGGPVLAVILPVAEQQVLRLAQEDRVVPDVAVGDLGEDLRPDGGVRALVFGDLLRPDADHHAHALHRVPPIVRGELGEALRLHRVEVPFDADAGRRGASAMPFSMREPRRRQLVELRNVLDIFAVRHGAGEADMQLHQEMRADRHVEGLRRMRDLEPGRDAADARDIDLHDRAGALGHIFAEMADRIERLADRDRRRRRARQPDMAVEIVGRQRLLDPGEVEIGEAPGAPDRLVEREALVGVGHDLVSRPQRRAHGGEPAIVLRHMRAADLDLGAAEALVRGRERILDQRALSMCSQPPSVV